MTVQRIMAIGAIVFDSSLPQCTAAHPTPDEQYEFEWAFAHLDLNGDRYLDQTELQVVRNSAPEIASDLPTDGKSLDLISFVQMLRLAKAVESNALEIIKEHLKQPFLYARFYGE